MIRSKLVDPTRNLPRQAFAVPHRVHEPKMIEIEIIAIARTD